MTDPINPRTLEAAMALADLQARVIERVKQNRVREPFNDGMDECPSCGAPLYGDEPCCEGDGK